MSATSPAEAGCETCE